jgi:hypothetical protein
MHRQVVGAPGLGLGAATMIARARTAGGTSRLPAKARNKVASAGFSLILNSSMCRCSSLVGLTISGNKKARPGGPGRAERLMSRETRRNQ